MPLMKGVFKKNSSGGLDKIEKNFISYKDLHTSKKMSNDIRNLPESIQKSRYSKREYTVNQKRNFAEDYTPYNEKSAMRTDEITNKDKRAG